MSDEEIESMNTKSKIKDLKLKLKELMQENKLLKLQIENERKDEIRNLAANSQSMLMNLNSNMFRIYAQVLF